MCILCFGVVLPPSGNVLHTFCLHLGNNKSNLKSALMKNDIIIIMVVRENIMNMM